jgi:hypothetical protein
MARAEKMLEVNSNTVISGMVSDVASAAACGTVRRSPTDWAAAAVRIGLPKRVPHGAMVLLEFMYHCPPEERAVVFSKQIRQGCPWRPAWL